MSDVNVSDFIKNIIKEQHEQNEKLKEAIECNSPENVYSKLKEYKIIESIIAQYEDDKKLDKELNTITEVLKKGKEPSSNTFDFPLLEKFTFNFVLCNNFPIILKQDNNKFKTITAKTTIFNSVDEANDYFKCFDLVLINNAYYLQTISDKEYFSEGKPFKFLNNYAWVLNESNDFGPKMVSELKIGDRICLISEVNNIISYTNECVYVNSIPYNFSDIVKTIDKIGESKATYKVYIRWFDENEAVVHEKE